MRNSNWMITDINNKKQDILSFYKSIMVRNSEELILKIAALSKFNMTELFSEWKTIPVNFRVNNKNLGCS